MKQKSFLVIIPLFITLFVVTACSLFIPKAQPADATGEPDFGPTGGPLKFTPDTLPIAQIGKPYEVKIQITLNNTPVGDFFISEGSLPEGLEFTFLEGEDAATISGTPTETGNFSLKVGAWCYGTQVSGQTGDKAYSLVVRP
jgi:hypothetical protein